MSRSVVEIDGWEVTLPGGWRNITSEVEAEEPPLTLSRDDGEGALQFTLATYKSGEDPDATGRDLIAMRKAFAAKHRLRAAFDAREVNVGRAVCSAASYRWGEDFVRLWYCSDTSNFAIATYVCPWGRQDEELADCERIIESLRFPLAD